MCVPHTKASKYFSLSKLFHPRNCRIWNPHLIRRNLQSELLGKKFSIICTYNTLDLIDKHFGFDFYILETPDYDLKSKLGMDLKRLMLLRLLDPNIDPELREKYGKYTVSMKEAMYVGLSFAECIDLNRKIVSKSTYEQIQ